METDAATKRQIEINFSNLNSSYESSKLLTYFEIVQMCIGEGMFTPFGPFLAAKNVITVVTVLCLIT